MKKLELNNHLISTRDAGYKAIKAIAAARVLIAGASVSNVYLYHDDIVRIKSALNDSGHNIKNGLTIGGVNVIDAGKP